MAIIIILNVVFAALVVGGILTLLSSGIAADSKTAHALTAPQRVAQRARRHRSGQVIGAPLHHSA